MSRMKRPTLAELREYAKEIGYHRFNAEHFRDYYEMVGWVVGRGKPMVSWKAAVNNWRNQESRFGRMQPTLRGPMPYNKRQDTINKLNRRKAELLREPQTKKVLQELEQIRIQLMEL